MIQLKMPRAKRHLVCFLLRWLLFSLVNLTEATSANKTLAEKHLDSVLGDRNASRLVLPFEKTVIIDGTQGPKIDSFFNSSQVGSSKGTRPNITENDGKPLALIIVMSQPLPEERLRRDAIRNSWARWAPALNMKVVFFLGIRTSNSTAQLVSSLMDEITNFGDIIIDNIEEDYFRLTAKILRSFKWFLKRYSNEKLRPTFFVKTDTDVFINLRHLADVLKKVPDPNSFIGGHVWKNAQVYRNPQDKYFMPLSYWPKNAYPDFTLGWFYVFSSSQIPVVFKASLEEKLIQLEDVYVTGMISKSKLKLNLTAMPGIVKHSGKVTKTAPWRKGTLAFHLPDADLTSFLELYNEFELGHSQ